MVKAICYTLAAVALCVGVFVFAQLYLDRQFEEFHGALDALYEKIEDETATRGDALAVKAVWDDKKKKLHILIPHNDISYVDYWLNETCGLLTYNNYELALGKIEVLKEITKNLPDAYSLKLENIF